MIQKTARALIIVAAACFISPVLGMAKPKMKDITFLCVPLRQLTNGCPAGEEHPTNCFPGNVKLESADGDLEETIPYCAAAQSLTLAHLIKANEADNPVRLTLSGELFKKLIDCLDKLHSNDKKSQKQRDPIRNILFPICEGISLKGAIELFKASNWLDLTALKWYIQALIVTEIHQNNDFDKINLIVASIDQPDLKNLVAGIRLMLNELHSNLLVQLSLERPRHVFNMPAGQYLITFNVLENNDIYVLSSSDSAFAGQESCVFNMQNPKICYKLLGLAEGTDIGAISDDGKLVLAEDNTDTIGVWDLTQAAEEISLCKVLKGYNGQILSVQFSANAVYALLTSNDEKIYLYDLRESGKALKPCKIFEGIHGIISPDNQYAITGGRKRRNIAAKFLDLKEIEPVKILATSMPSVTTFAMSADNHYALTAYEHNNSVDFWNLTEKGPEIKPLKNLEGHRNGIWSIAISPNGKYGVTGSSDNTAIVWNLATRELIARLKGHFGPVKPVMFSKDNKSILTASSDNIVRLWSLAGSDKIPFLALVLMIKASQVAEDALPNSPYSHALDKLSALS